MKKFVYTAALALTLLTACEPGMGTAEERHNKQARQSTAAAEEGFSSGTLEVLGKKSLHLFGEMYVVKVTDHRGGIHTVVAFSNGAADGGVAICELNVPDSCNTDE